MKSFSRACIHYNTAQIRPTQFNRGQGALNLTYVATSMLARRLLLSYR